MSTPQRILKCICGTSYTIYYWGSITCHCGHKMTHTKPQKTKLNIKAGETYYDGTVGQHYVCIEDGELVAWYKDWQKDIVANSAFPPNTSGLSDDELDELLQMFESAIKEDRKASAEPPIFVPPCTCELNALMRVGCKCGAFEAEIKEQERKERIKKKKIKEALKKGMPYHERVKKYGEG